MAKFLIRNFFLFFIFYQPILRCKIIIVIGSSSYHPNRRSARYPDREKDRLDRLERERERIHARERDVMSYNLNEDELVNDRHYAGGGGVGSGGVGGASSGSEYPMHRDERRVIDRDIRERDQRDRMMDARDRREHYVGTNSRHLMNNSYDNDNVDLIREKEKERFAHRRDEYSYSPHRGNRRVLNMNAM